MSDTTSNLKTLLADKKIDWLEYIKRRRALTKEKEVYQNVFNVDLEEDRKQVQSLIKDKNETQLPSPLQS